jgi:carboxylate-amine ligase
LSEQTFEDLTFRPSREISLGVELELQVLDRETGDLVPGALRILDACAEEGIDGVAGEFLLSMIEVRTGVCRSVAEVRDDLFPRLRRVRNIAGSLGYDLAVGGTHPFARPSASAFFPDERYQRIQEQQGWLASQEAIFGLHVHVGVPGADAAVGLINLLVPYLPHLLALSANSAFWQGIDTGYASARSRMFRPSANCGIPPHFPSWEDFVGYCRVLHQGGAITATKDLYWDLRPRPQLGTIEFRIFDAPATLSGLLALAALSRCLVLDGLRLLAERPKLGEGDPACFWLAQENKWRAGRYGLAAECVRRPGGERRTLADDTARLLERLLPVARRAGEAGFLGPLLPVDRFEPGAARLRHLFRQTGSWQAVVDDMRCRWALELEDAPGPEAAPAPPGSVLSLT